MGINKIKILFFGSGDFPVPTFDFIVNKLNEKYEIVGLVTSRDKVIYNKYRLYDIAQQNNIPIHIPKDLNCDETYNWCKEKNADVFCVISYKKLPSQLYKLAKGCAFNVHASLLPLLKGASPIYWALLYGFKETGLTSFILNDNIDSGNIICNHITKIENNETFGTLYQKLMNECIIITKNTLIKIGIKTENQLLKEHQLFYQPSRFNEYKAPKNLKTLNNISFSLINYFDRLFRASMPNDGLDASINVYSINNENIELKPLDLDKGPQKTYNIKIWDCEIIDFTKLDNNIPYNIEERRGTNIRTDGKTYLYILFPTDRKMVKVNTIQIKGKKKLNIEEFLRGFQYARNENFGLKFETNLVIKENCCIFALK